MKQTKKINDTNLIRIERIWAMPNKNTFDIKPIANLLHDEVNLTKIWIDPFANKNKMASITNDLSSDYDTDYHLDALDFLKLFDDNSVDGVLYDPPYSPRQVSECYNKVGFNVTWDTTKASFWGNHKKEISRILKIGGKVITFGWNSGGIGYKYGFEIQRILMVPHGGWHNDTICTVETKIHDGCFEKIKNTKELTKMLNSNDLKLIDKLKALPLDYWDFKGEDVREYTHGIHNYPAMMVYPISRNIINIVSEVQPITALFDPFAGSGTVLVEGMLKGIEKVSGNDINPLALYLTKVKTTPLDELILKKEVIALYKILDGKLEHSKSILESVDSFIVDQLGLDLAAKAGWGENASEYLRKYCSDKGFNISIPDFKNLGYWFRPRVILELQLIKDEIQKIENTDIRDFIFIAFSESIRFVSNRRTGEFKMFRMPVDKVQSFNPKTYDEFKKILDRNVIKMISFTKKTNELTNHSNVRVFTNNACTLEDLEDYEYDLIVTSPPYGDSRTTVAYGEYSRLSLQWLNLNDMTEREILNVDKSLMGGKKFRNGFEYTLPSDTLRRSLEKIIDLDIERAGDVYSFYSDLNESIMSISKKTKAGGYHFWVVGNRTVKNEVLLTDVIIAEMASKYGLTYIYTIDRNIPNKSMPSLNSPSNVTGIKSSTMKWNI